MRFKITNTKYNDYFIVKSSELSGCIVAMEDQVGKRGWKQQDCLSELLK